MSGDPNWEQVAHEMGLVIAAAIEMLCRPYPEAEEVIAKLREAL